jgi:hypothetical protein
MKDIQKQEGAYNDAVAAIKEAILRSQYRAVSTVNREQLSLYYGIGRYVSLNSRKGFWRTGAIDKISEQLQKELPGLRGFSATSIRKMRHFYDEWASIINWPPLAANLQVKDNECVINWSPAATNLTPVVEVESSTPQKICPKCGKKHCRILKNLKN